jgi:glycosyltransferase involved in cell wall biosynthesis
VIPEMNVGLFAGGLDATLAARVLPLNSCLREFGVNCNITLPIDWQPLVGCKLGNVLSTAFTHSLSSYVNVLRDFPDIVIIGRTSTPQIYLLQKLLKHRNTKVVFDLNDALFLLTSRFCGTNLRSGSFCLERIIKNADFVTVNGHYLLKYVQEFNQNSAILHDVVDVNLFVPSPKRVTNKITIGWHGNPRVHYENLRMLLKPLEKLGYNYDVKLKLVSYLGDIKIKQMFKSLEKTMDVDYGLDHWVPMTQYHQLLSDIDIMVAPLQKTAWYEGKSALRVGLGMAMGIPVVASPVGEQKYVVEQGVNGFLAKNENEWVTYISTLMEDDYLRKEMGIKGRKTAEQKLSVNACGKKLFNIFQNLMHCS